MAERSEASEPRCDLRHDGVDLNSRLSMSLSIGAEFSKTLKGLQEQMMNALFELQDNPKGAWEYYERAFILFSSRVVNRLCHQMCADMEKIKEKLDNLSEKFGE